MGVVIYFTELLPKRKPRLAGKNLVLYYELMSEKIVGYVLLVLGIAIIIFSVVSVYSVLTGKSIPAQIFTTEGISLDLAALSGGGLSREQKENLAKQNISTKTQLVTPELLNSPLNLMTHLFLMGFIASAGFKIAMIGTTLVRPIKVNLKSKEAAVAESSSSK